MHAFSRRNDFVTVILTLFVVHSQASRQGLPFRPSRQVVSMGRTLRSRTYCRPIRPRRLAYGCNAKAVVIRHFRSPVPRQRSIEFSREFAGVSYQGVDHSLRILAGHFYQHHESTLTFDES
jgi:hypothetical protein